MSRRAEQCVQKFGQQALGLPSLGALRIAVPRGEAVGAPDDSAAGPGVNLDDTGGQGSNKLMRRVNDSEPMEVDPAPTLPPTPLPVAPPAATPPEPKKGPDPVKRLESLSGQLELATAVYNLFSQWNIQTDQEGWENYASFKIQEYTNAFQAKEAEYFTFVKSRQAQQQAASTGVLFAVQEATEEEKKKLRRTKEYETQLGLASRVVKKLVSSGFLASVPTLYEHANRLKERVDVMSKIAMLYSDAKSNQNTEEMELQFQKAVEEEEEEATRVKNAELKKKEQADAKKQQAKAEKEAAMLQKEAEKEATRQQKEAEKAAKQAGEEAKRVERQLKKEKEQAERDQKAAEKAAKQAEEEAKRKEREEAKQARDAETAAKKEKAEADRVERQLKKEKEQTERDQKAAERLAKKQDEASQRDANKRRPVQNIYKDMTDEQWEQYKQRKAAQEQAERDYLAAGNTKDSFMLELGNRLKAEEEQQRKLAANEAITNWDIVKTRDDVVIALLKRELKLVRAMVSKSEADNSSDELKQIADRLKRREEIIVEELTQLGVKVNVTVDPYDEFLKDFPGVSKEDYIEFDRQRDEEEEARKKFLDSGDKTPNDWRVERGYAIKAEFEIRKSTHANSPENAFPLASWKAYKADNPIIQKRIEARVYDLLDTLERSFNDTIKKRKRIADALEQELYELNQKQEAAGDTVSEEANELSALIESKKQEYEDAYNLYYETNSNAKKFIEDKLYTMKAELEESKKEVERIEKEARDAASKERKEKAREAREKAAAEAKKTKEAAKEAAKAAKAAKREEEKARKRGDKAKEAALRKERIAREKEEKKARIAERKANRKANALEDVVDRLGAASSKQAELASALAIFDNETERLQSKLDRQQEVKLSYDAADFPWLGEDGQIPEQPVIQRKRDEGGSTEQDTMWPVTQVPLTPEQHGLLFISETDAFPEVADEEDAESTTTNDAASTVEKMELDETDADAPIGAPASKTIKKLSKLSQEELNAREKLLSKLQEDDVIESEVILFNKAYARMILAEHIRSVKEQHRYSLAVNSKALFVDLAGCLGPITVDGSPEGEIDDEKLEATVEQLLPTFEAMLRYRNTVLKVKEIELQNEMKLIGQTQPAKLNQMKASLAKIQEADVKAMWGEVAARRMLQSEKGQLPGQLYVPQPAHLPLRISAPPRVGKSATALLVASLAKRVGMTVFYSVSPNKITPVAEMTKKLARIGWRGVDEAKKADNALEGTANENQKGVELKCTRMNFNFKTIDQLVSDGDASSNCVLKPDVDFVLYSSDVVGDVQKAGALLASARRSETVVFHMRDEAQSLAKEEKNESVACHSEFVPPPPTLQYLRHYFGNLYGLNCLVTATLFPTFLEENLWGFFGSCAQNVRAGLSIAAGTKEIKSTLGSNYLPKITPALLPYVSTGYIGVDSVVAWRYKTALKAIPGKGPYSNGDPVFEARAKAKGEVATLQYGADHSGVRYDGTVRTVETASAIVEATKQKERRSKRGKKKGDDKLDEDLSNMIEDAEQQAKLSTKQAIGGDQDGDDTKDVDYKPTAESKLTKKDVAAKKRMWVNEDARAIDAFFEDWLEAEEGRIDSFREDTEPEENFTATQDRLVPIFIGALNRNVADDAMVSFVRHFGVLAHNKTKVRRKKNLPADKESCGVAFCLFSSVFKNREDIEKKGGGIRFHDDEEVDEVDGIKGGASFRPCDGAQSKPDMSLVCFIYNPEHDRNAASDKESEKTDAVPAFEVFLAPAAEVAIEEVWLSSQIAKIAILGYGMLQAGLTVQSIVEAPLIVKDIPRITRGQPRPPILKEVGTYKRIYCPQYCALATSDTAALDAQLQILGRSFVELKGVVAPSGWKIQLLGVKNMATTMQNYSDMETILSNINKKAGGKLTLYEALKESFNSTLVAENNYGTLGVVGVRRGDFGSILGLTAEVAARRAAAAARARERAERAGITDRAQADQLAKEELADAEREAKDEREANEDGESSTAASDDYEEQAEALLEEAGGKRASDNSGDEDDARSYKRSRAGIKTALLEAPGLARMLSTGDPAKLRILQTIFSRW